MEPVFQVIQDYITARQIKAEFNDVCIIIRWLVPVRAEVLQSSEAGFIAFTKADRDILKMNLHIINTIHLYILTSVHILTKQTDHNFSRKPGLLVSYETTDHGLTK